jgi:hypothetical protein
MERLDKIEIGILLDMTAKLVAKQMGIRHPQDVTEDAVDAVYRRLWAVDKLGTELGTDRDTVEHALCVVALERETPRT